MCLFVCVHTDQGNSNSCKGYRIQNYKMLGCTVTLISATYVHNFSHRLQLSGPEKENAEKEALRLSLKYNFVTPLTSMVVTKPPGESTDVLHKPKEGAAAEAFPPRLGSFPVRQRMLSGNTRPICSTGEQHKYKPKLIEIVFSISFQHFISFFTFLLLEKCTILFYVCTMQNTQTTVWKKAIGTDPL